MICHRFLYGTCPFSALSCNFSHSKEYAPLCRMWTKGKCKGSTGNACRFRHFYNEFDGLAVQKENNQRLHPANVLSEDDFNSPYRLKVVKEVSKQRKEEVDLETGKRKSWVETTEFEVLDLTGETPAKKKRPLETRSPLRELVIEGGKADLSAESVVNPSICPICKKTFKGTKGVKSHQSAKNSSCRSLRENQEVDSIVTSSLPYSSSDTADDSIIVIPDTPVTKNLGAPSKRLLRSRNRKKE